jgi:hypothetical protein
MTARTRAAAAPAAAVGAQTKYRAVKGEIDGIKFDSQAEGRRYLVLRDRLQRGEISALEPHPPAYRLEVNGVLVSRYTPDFRYVVVATGQTVVEDVKSNPTKTRDYVMRRKLMKALYGIEIQEVTGR